MSTRRALLLALGATPGLAAGAGADPSPAAWELQARWVHWALPAGTEAPVGTRRWANSPLGSTLEPLGTSLRLSTGAEGGWVLGSDATPGGPPGWVTVGPLPAAARPPAPPAAPVHIQVPVGLAPSEPAATQRLWVRLEAVRPGRPGGSGESNAAARLALRWEGASLEGRADTLHTTRWVPVGRWATVLRHDDPAPARPAAPGELRSSDAAPRRSRELQVRLTPLQP